MTSIRFVAIDYPDISLVQNLANNLSSRQNEFQFLVHDKVLSLGKRRTAPELSLEKIENMATELCASTYPDEYPVVICNQRFTGYRFARISEEVTIINTGTWPTTSSRNFLQKYIAFTLVDALMSQHVQLLAHYDCRGCVADTWTRDLDVKKGLANCDYCSECRSRILGTIGTDISLSQVAAIFRILDYVANRKTCFVIMPFSKAFEDIYTDCLQKALEARGWVCRRADKIFQSREIMMLVWEEILRSDMIIADLTGRNANVFYELGYAHALDKPTLLITQSIDDVPFDLRHRRLIEYVSTRKGLKKLSAEIGEYL